MKLLFCARPAFGHLYPLVPMALAARASGHDVAFATAEPFTTRLGALGFDTHLVGLTLDEARARLDRTDTAGDGLPVGEDGRPDLELAGHLFVDVLGRSTAADLATLVGELDVDLIVYEQGEFGAAVVAHAVGIPAVCHTLSPQMPPEMQQLIFGARLERLWADHGMASPATDPDHRDLQLDPFPTVLQLPSFVDDPLRVPMRPTPFAEPGATRPSWIDQLDRPLVYLTLGTVMAADELLTPALHGLAALDADVLVALGSADGARLGTLPGNVHVEAFVDQPAVLSHAALVAHHGGSGTVLAALLSGTPQLLLPKGADQFLNADSMVTNGLALALEPAEATPAAVTSAAAELIGQPFPAAMTARDELIARPEPAAVLAEVMTRLDLDDASDAAA